jgi:hypothetical protein
MANKPSHFVILNRSDHFDLPGLADALSRSLGIIRFDAISQLKRSWGLLHKTDMIDKAQELQQKLKQEGIETFVLSASELRPIPRPRVLRKAIPEPGGLGFQEKGQNKLLPWDSVVLLCAGQVQESVSVKEMLPPDGKAVKWLSRTGLSLTTGVAIVHEASKRREVTKDRTDFSYYLDLIAKDDFESVRILGDSFDYSYLGGRKAHNVSFNFKSLALDIAKFLPNVAKNQGMRAMETQAMMKDLKYGSLNDFENEKLWLIQLNADSDN